MKAGGREPSLWDHLAELRRRFLRSLVVWLLASGASFFVVDRVLGFLSAPVGDLFFLGLPEGLLVRIKTAGALGLLLVGPWLLWELWGFLSPGLKTKEKRALSFGLLASAFLFYAGVLLGALVMVPWGARVLIALGGDMVPVIRANDYLGFVVFMALAMGSVFLTPVVMVTLTAIGLLDPSSLARRRSYVIVGIFVLAAVLTPSVDFLGQLMMAVPLWLLFEVGVLASKIVARRK